MSVRPRKTRAHLGAIQAAFGARSRQRTPPTLFLDIDGVLAPLAATTRHRPVRIGGWHSTILIDHEVIRELVKLHNNRQLNIQWLTSWEDDANLMLAPAVGLDTYPVHAEPTTTRSGWWKAEVIAKHATQNPRFIWADDELTSHDPSHLNALYPDALLLEVDPTKGLTPSHLDTIRAYTN